MRASFVSLATGDAPRRGSNHHRDMDATSVSASGAGAATVSPERAFLSDARVSLAVLNWARHRVLTGTFGVSRDQVNLLTFLLVLGAANATYDAARRIIRHPWPLSRLDSAIAGTLVRESGFAIAGPAAREVSFFWGLVAVAGLGGLAVPGMRRGLYLIRVAEQRLGQARMRFWGTAQHAADPSGAASVTPAT